MTVPHHTHTTFRRRVGHSLPVRVALCVVVGAGMAAAANAAAAPARAQTQTSFALVGRGWGHGIGMSQWGAYGYARHGWKYDAIIKHYYTGVTLGKVANLTVRIMLNEDLSSVSVTDASGFKATSGSKTVSITGGAIAKVTWSSGKYKLTAGSSSWTFANPVVFKPGGSRLKLLNADQNGHVGHYRGQLRVIRYTAGFMVVNSLALESYLYGVVPRESPSSWPIEALKAQAVAARSYAYGSIGRSGPFDVYCTTASQMYGGADGEATSSDQAVDATKGVVPKYAGKAITAFFFSTSGGHTENIENVWNTSAVPYLKGVPDPYEPAYDPVTHTGAYYHIWPDNPITRSASTLAGELGTYSATRPFGVKGILRTIYVVKRGTSPRVVKALVIGDAGYSVIAGYDLRYYLNLRDAWVSFTSLSISPSAATKRIITYGKSTTVSGRLFPGRANGSIVTIHRRPAGDSWVTAGASTKRGSLSLGGYTVWYSDYSHSVKPLRNTQYYFTSSPGASPKTTIYVKPAVTLATPSPAPSAGDTVTFTGTVKPTVSGETLWLQTKSGSAWSDRTSTTLKSDGTFSVAWTAVSGTTSFRIRVPKSTTMAQGTSATVTVTVP